MVSLAEILIVVEMDLFAIIRHSEVGSNGWHKCQRIQSTLSSCLRIGYLNENWNHNLLHDPRNESRAKCWHRQEYLQSMFSMVSQADFLMSVEVDLITVIQQLGTNYIIAINKSQCKWQYLPFIQKRIQIFVFSTMQGVSWDQSIEQGKSNCSRHSPYCLKLKSSVLLKLTFSQSSDTLS